MSRYKSEQTAYSSLKRKYVPLWRLDTNTMTVTKFNADTQNEESKTYHIDFIRYHLHFSDSHCPDRLRRLVNEGMIIQYLDDMELKVGEAIARQYLLRVHSRKLRFRQLHRSHILFLPAYGLLPANLLWIWWHLTRT